MKVIIKRQDSPESEPYFREFEYTGGKRETVAHILDELNYKDDLLDINGNHERRIVWECSCMQKMCGACAMVINGYPGLACSVFIDTGKDKELLLEPLSKFPVICDLKVDRSIIQEQSLLANMYAGSCRKPDEKKHDHLYSAAKCLKCGLCLEICPNYSKGRKFFGAAFANESYLLCSMSAERKEKIKEEYDIHFSAGCSKAFDCRNICPMDIPTIASIAAMNRRQK